MPHRYRVIKTCFYGGVFREPGSKHALVTLADKLEDVPTSFEYLGETKAETVARKTAKKKSSPKRETPKDSVAASDQDVI